ncbi:AF4/FMR2 family member 1 isoform X1 [Esox lucius]|uniref:AF4/FMR2 C-terminal homology domain-containing protein n=1 Tax=Esox lucius TaxID=8010 RepID=A0A3P9AG27_ESOLU|nr:AF4/FMR2 family member 1 isoform X1 [Esox lucius]
MAARSSYNEERNLLRIREWERRNQEALQEKEFFQENIPLFGEPYKTNKGDELSSRIQRMLGSYEDVNNPNPHQCLDSLSKDPPSHVSTTYVKPSYGRDRGKPPFQHSPQYGVGQGGAGGPPTSSHFSQPLKKLPGPPPSYVQSSLSLNQGQASPDFLQRKGEPCPWPDLRECASLPPVLSALSPPAEPLSPLHSSDPSDSEPQDTPDRHIGSSLHPERHPASPLHPDSPIPMVVSPLDDLQRDIPLAASEGTALPSQTFPPPLASISKVVMPQKPTAYVRPMDGQDQVTSESPDLKPSPEDFHGQSYHEPLPELKSTKPSLSKLKIPSQSIETLSNEAHSVEDILREMTHSWPPLLTAIHTPSTAEPSKFSFPVKEAQHDRPAFPGQKHYESPPAVPSSTNCEQSSSTVITAHSSGVESASSSDSESSSGSESDSESGTEEPPQPLRISNPPVPKAEGPVVTNWQLINWIRGSQQNSTTESQSDAVHTTLPKVQQGQDAEDEGEVVPPSDYKSNKALHGPEFSDNEAKVQCSEETAHNQHVHHTSPATTRVGDCSGQRKTVGNKHPSRPVKAPHLEAPQAGLRVESVEVAPRDKDPLFTDRPKVKTKTGHGSCKSTKTDKTDSKKPTKRISSEKRKTKQLKSEGGGPKATLVPKREYSPSPAQRVDQAVPSVKTTPSVRTETLPALQKGQKKPRGQSPGAAHEAKHESPAKDSTGSQGPPQTLMVKIELSLLSRVPAQNSRLSQGCQDSATRKRSSIALERGDTEPAAPIPTKVNKKRPAEKDVKAPPRKKSKPEELKSSSSGPSSRKSEMPKNPDEEKPKKKSKKGCPVPEQQPNAPQDHGKKMGGHKRPAGLPPEPIAASAANSRNRQAFTNVKQKSTSKHRTEHSKTGKKAPMSSFSFSVPAQPTGAALSSRPLLKFDDKLQAVEYYMKEAKKLKHKADATSDKVGKAFNYLDAAMSFMESGIAMETDPQTPKSAYTMFAETLDLIRFILKLKGSVDHSSPATDKDFIVLCMRCQSLLQMAMFRNKRETALKYSRTLTDHFKSSSKSAAQAPSPCVSKSTGTPSPMSPMPSPASSASSGPGSNHSSGVGMGTMSSVAIPQVIQQVASSYVNITALFLSAHDIWEQADELAHKGSGLLSELNSALGPLNLTSNISSLVRHTRQGLQWLRLDIREAK